MNQVQIRFQILHILHQQQVKIKLSTMKVIETQENQVHNQVEVVRQR
jgi:hypothetical protein